MEGDSDSKTQYLDARHPKLGIVSDHYCAWAGFERYLTGRFEGKARFKKLLKMSSVVLFFNTLVLLRVPVLSQVEAPEGFPPHTNIRSVIFHAVTLDGVWAGGPEIPAHILGTSLKVRSIYRGKLAHPVM